MDKTTIPNSTGELTSRQREFLQSLVTLYKAHGQAVSYMDVASDMKVSKWTAYDILHGLYERGFLQMTHEITSGKGRSRILYAPTENILAHTDTTVDEEAESTTLRWLRQNVRRYAEHGVANSIGIITRRIAREENPYRVVLYTCVMVVLLAEVFRLDIERIVNIREFTALSLSSDMVLGLLTGVMFSLMRKEEGFMTHLALPQQSIQDFTECEESFMASVAQLSAGEKRLMVSVLGQAFAS